MAHEREKPVYTRRQMGKFAFTALSFGAAAYAEQKTKQAISYLADNAYPDAQLIGLTVPPVDINVGPLEFSTPEIDVPLPEMKFLKAHSLSTQLDVNYNPTANLKIGAGDSNMLLGTDYNAISPLDHFVTDMNGRRLGKWDKKNLAFEAATPQQVLEQTIKTADFRRLLSTRSAVHLWLDLGGNNLKNLVQTQQEVDSLKKIANIHIGAPQDILLYKDIVLDIEKKVYKNLNVFKEGYYELLGYIMKNFGERISNIEVNGAPNYSYAKDINLGSVGVFSLQNYFAKRVANTASILITNNIAEVADSYWDNKRPFAKIALVNAFDIHDFSEGIHYGDGGSRQLATLASEKYRGYPRLAA